MNSPMYKISSTNDWHNGREFDSLVEAKEYADKHSTTYVCDVLAFVDRDTFRAVYTGGERYIPVVRGTYQKGS